jgi:hypothetical protein
VQLLVVGFRLGMVVLQTLGLVLLLLLVVQEALKAQVVVVESVLKK